MALALIPFAKEIADFVREKLPPDTHFGVLVLVPNSDPKLESRIIALTSDRHVVAHAAGQWVLNILSDKSGT